MSGNADHLDPYFLTGFDEFPVHTTPYPISYKPITDYNFDEGWYWGVFNPDEKVFFCTGMRINPNTDMIGGYALLNLNGLQRTFRFSRCWRQEWDLHVGPWRAEFPEPLKTCRLVLEENDSGIAFDILWKGASPAFLEGHHTQTVRGRRTTDMSRFSQPGTTSGTLKLDDRTWDLGKPGWVGVRDRSWGLYVERPPIAVDPKWLPPRHKKGNERALRFWVLFKAGDLSGFYHIHEDPEGRQRDDLDDVFSSPFGGRFYRGWNDDVIEFASASHQIEFVPGTRMMKRATITLIDTAGGEWVQEMEVAAPPWVIQTMGYTPGSWKDGGQFHCYHGSEELATEWDEFDFSEQPFEYTPYGVAGRDEPDTMHTGLSYKDKIHGVEYLVRLKTTAPDGKVAEGAGHLELFIQGPYKPYGFK